MSGDTFLRILQKHALPVEEFAQGCGLPLAECWHHILSKDFSGLELRVLENGSLLVGQTRRRGRDYWRGAERCPLTKGTSTANWIYGHICQRGDQLGLVVRERWNKEAEEFEFEDGFVAVETPPWFNSRLVDIGQCGLAYSSGGKKWHLAGGVEGALLTAYYSDFVEFEKFKPEDYKNEEEFYRWICQLRGSELTPKSESLVARFRPAQVTVYFGESETEFSGISYDPQTGKYFVGDLRWWCCIDDGLLSDVAVSFDLGRGTDLLVSPLSTIGLLDLPIWRPLEDYLQNSRKVSKENTIAIVDWDRLCGDPSLSIIGFVHECPPDARFKARMNLEGGHFIVRSEGRYYVGFEFDRRSWSFGISSEGVVELSFADIIEDAISFSQFDDVITLGKDLCADQYFRLLRNKAKPIWGRKSNQLRSVLKIPDVKFFLVGSLGALALEAAVDYGSCSFPPGSEQLPGRVWIADEKVSSIRRTRNIPLENQITDKLKAWGFDRVMRREDTRYYMCNGQNSGHQVAIFLDRGVKEIKRMGWHIELSKKLQSTVMKLIGADMESLNQEDAVDSDLSDTRPLERDDVEAEAKGALTANTPGIEPKRSGESGAKKKRDEAGGCSRHKGVCSGTIFTINKSETSGKYQLIKVTRSKDESYRITNGSVWDLLDKLLDAGQRWIEATDAAKNACTDELCVDATGADKKACRETEDGKAFFDKYVDFFGINNKRKKPIRQAKLKEFCLIRKKEK